MTPDDFRAALERLGLSQVGAAVVLGVSAREVRRYVAGQSRIPNAIRILLIIYERLPKLMEIARAMPR